MSPIYVGNRAISGSLSSDPVGVSTSAGSIYYSTTEDKLRFYNGTEWANVGSVPFAGDSATHWWKNESITQSTWTATTGGVNFTEQNGSLTYTASDSRFNNLKSIGNTGNNQTYMTADTGSNGSFWNASNAFSFIAVIDKVAHNSGGSYGDGCFIHQWNGQADGSWSLDLTGDHTWGGSYGESFGYNSPPGSYPQKGILMVRIGNGGSNGAIEWWPVSGSSWSVRDTCSGWPNNISSTYDALNIFNFTSSTASSHRFSGAYAELAYFKNIRITDAVRDAWKAYLVEKFNF